MDAARDVSLVTATMAMGFVAAVFVFYSTTVMPGLRTTDDHTFVTSFQSLDRAILNPLFLGFGFVGALLLTGLAGLLHLGGERRSVLPWIAAAFVLYLVAFVITITVHVPLNDGIKAEGAPDRIADLSAVRAQFDEARWLVWNHVRSVSGSVAFGCLCWALVLLGRTQ